MARQQRAYPAYLDGDEKARLRELDRQLGRAMRGRRGRQLLLEHLAGDVRKGWFRLPHVRHPQGAAVSMGSRRGRMFDYIAAGGIRSLHALRVHPSVRLGRLRTLAAAWMLIVLWVAFRFIPAP